MKSKLTLMTGRIGALLVFSFLLIFNVSLSKVDESAFGLTLEALKVSAQSSGEENQDCIEYRTNYGTYIQHLPTQCCQVERSVTTCYDYTYIGTNCPVGIGTSCLETVSYIGQNCCA